MFANKNSAAQRVLKNNMGYEVSVRDSRELEKALGKGKGIILPQECVHNRNIIRTLLGNYGSGVWSGLANADLHNLSLISDSVAYLMRPDIVMGGERCLTPVEMPPLRYSRFKSIIRGAEGETIHLKNDPKNLTPDFALPKDSEYSNMGAEFFRCYSATFVWMTEELKEKLGYCESGSYAPAFSLADMTAYLLSPTDITEYKYDSQTLEDFKRRLSDDLRAL